MLSLVVPLVFLVVFLGLPFVVVRSAAEQGVRRALKTKHLRPWPPGR